MRKVKKIYRYVNRLTPCMWCRGTGWNRKAFTDKPCYACDGKGGEWQRERELVGEEVTG